MKKNTIIFMLSVFVSMFSFAQKSTNYITVNTSTKQDWYGGISYAHGTSYNFNITIADDIKIVFDSIWVGPDTVIPVFYPYNTVLKFSKDSKIKLSATFQTMRPYVDSDSIKKYLSKCPVEFTGAAVIRYYIKKKAYYYTVATIQTLSTLEYP